MLNIVITMGGVGSRFQKAGYSQPKYCIEAKGRSLFDWSMISLDSFKNLNPTYIFIVKSTDNARDFILESCERLEISPVKIVEIDELTDGQATTALYGKPHWKPENPILIFNIDTHIEPNYLLPLDIKGDGWIPCFQAKGDSWSFVKLNSDNYATEVREKNRISEYASVGVYWFSSAELYEDVYNKYYSGGNREEKGERYIAPLYNQLISDGLQVTILDIPVGRVHVIGTPEELNEFVKSDYNLP